MAINVSTSPPSTGALSKIQTTAESGLQMVTAVDLVDL